MAYLQMYVAYSLYLSTVLPLQNQQVSQHRVLTVERWQLYKEQLKLFIDSIKGNHFLSLSVLKSK